MEQDCPDQRAHVCDVIVRGSVCGSQGHTRRDCPHREEVSPAPPIGSPQHTRPKSSPPSSPSVPSTADTAATAAAAAAAAVAAVTAATAARPQATYNPPDHGGHAALHQFLVREGLLWGCTIQHIAQNFQGINRPRTGFQNWLGQVPWLEHFIWYDEDKDREHESVRVIPTALEEDIRNNAGAYLSAYGLTYTGLAQGPSLAEAAGQHMQQEGAYNESQDEASEKEEPVEGDDPRTSHHPAIPSNQRQSLATMYRDARCLLYICKRYNDSRGCAANESDCPRSRAHVCDILVHGRACGSRQHNRSNCPHRVERQEEAVLPPQDDADSPQPPRNPPTSSTRAPNQRQQLVITYNDQIICKRHNDSRGCTALEEDCPNYRAHVCDTQVEGQACGSQQHNRIKCPHRI